MHPVGFYNVNLMQSYILSQINAQENNQDILEIAKYLNLILLRTLASSGFCIYVQLKVGVKKIFAMKQIITPYTPPIPKPQNPDRVL